MEVKTERINRLGQFAFYGYSQYVQEVEKSKLQTNEKAEVYVHDAVEMPDNKGQRINYLI